MLGSVLCSNHTMDGDSGERLPHGRRAIGELESTVKNMNIEST